MDEGQDLLGFTDSDLVGAKLGEEKALQPLPECVIFKPGPHVHHIREVQDAERRA
jgi:hypothetical protein